MGKVFTLSNLFLWGNISLVLFLLVAVVKDNIREWKSYQKAYYQKQIDGSQAKAASAKTPEEKEQAQKELKAWKSRGLEIKQVIVEPLGAVDRCVTCHVGYDPDTNPSQTNTFQGDPFRAPENEVHKLHPVEKFGCAVCHGGQGLATTVKAAHGDVEHWEKPLLRKVMIQASCAKCHANVESLKISGRTYATAIIRAKEIIDEKGCIGCHQISGWGGPITVDLAEETADKPLTRIDFAYAGLPKEERTLIKWIKLHFIKDPATLVPGDPKGDYNPEPIAPSAMPFYNLAEDDANAVTAYILGLTTERIPREYYVYAPPTPEPQFASGVAHGRYIYDKYGCAACHGADGKGGIKNYNYEGDVEPDLTKSVGTFTREELIEKIHKGVPVVGKKDPKGPTPPLYMPPWKDKIKGKELDDLVAYLFSIAEKTEEW